MKIFIFFLLSVITVTAGAQDSSKAQLVGKYRFPGGSVVADADVVYENGNLMMNSSAGASALELIKGDSFNLATFNGYAVFKRNEVKKVIGVHIEASGYVLDGVKDAVNIKMQWQPADKQITATGNSLYSGGAQTAQSTKHAAGTPLALTISYPQDVPLGHGIVNQ